MSKAIHKKTVYKKAVYKIGEVASRLATSIRTVRYYEEEGLLIPTRTQGGTRLYSEQHIARLKIILKMAQAGFSIDAIRNVAQIREQGNTGNESSQLVDGSLQAIVDSIKTQIAELEKVELEISQARDVINKCKGCNNKASTQGCPACPVRDKLDDIDLLNLIWDTEQTLD